MAKAKRRRGTALEVMLQGVDINNCAISLTRISKTEILVQDGVSGSAITLKEPGAISLVQKLKADQSREFDKAHKLAMTHKPEVNELKQ